MALSDLKHSALQKEKARELRKSRWWLAKVQFRRCEYCQDELPEGQSLTMDHIVPVSSGGQTTKSNIAAVCKPCNNEKKNSHPVDWFLKQDRLASQDAQLP